MLFCRSCGFKEAVIGRERIVHHEYYPVAFLGQRFLNHLQGRQFPECPAVRVHFPGYDGCHAAGAVEIASGGADLQEFRFRVEVQNRNRFGGDGAGDKVAVGVEFPDRAAVVHVSAACAGFGLRDDASLFTDRASHGFVLFSF